MKTNYRRILMLTNSEVDGYYRYNDVFQIIPANDSAKRPPWAEADYPCVIEIKYNYEKNHMRRNTDGTEVSDFVQEHDIENKITVEICALFDLLCYSVFVDYNNEQSWFLNTEDNYKLCWGQKTYVDDSHVKNIETYSNISQVKKIEELDFNEYYKSSGRYVGSHFQIPDNLSKSLDSYYSLSDETKKVFLKAVTLFRNALRIKLISESIAFSCFVSSIETLINYEHKNDKKIKCESCGQDVYSVVKKFKEFITTYGSDSIEFIRYCTDIYTKRSNILHAGLLFAGEDLPLDFGDPNFESFFLKINAERITRALLINWLSKERTST